MTFWILSLTKGVQREALLSKVSHNVVYVYWGSMENNLEYGGFLMVPILYLQNRIIPKNLKKEGINDTHKKCR